MLATYNFNAIEILKSTGGLREMFLKDLEKRLLCLAILHVLLCKTYSFPWFKHHSSTINDVPRVYLQIQMYSWMYSFTSSYWLGISMLMSQGYIILNMSKTSQFSQPQTIFLCFYFSKYSKSLFYVLRFKVLDSSSALLLSLNQIWLFPNKFAVLSKVLN